MPGLVCIWMGDCLRVAKLSRYITSRHVQVDFAFYSLWDGRMIIMLGWVDWWCSSQFRCPAHDEACKETWSDLRVFSDPWCLWSFLERIGVVTCRETGNVWLGPKFSGNSVLCCILRVNQVNSCNVKPITRYIKKCISYIQSILQSFY